MAVVSGSGGAGVVGREKLKLSVDGAVVVEDDEVSVVGDTEKLKLKTKGSPPLMAHVLTDFCWEIWVGLFSALLLFLIFCKIHFFLDLVFLRQSATHITQFTTENKIRATSKNQSRNWPAEPVCRSKTRICNFKNSNSCNSNNFSIKSQDNQ